MSNGAPHPVLERLRRVVDELGYPAVLGAVFLWFAEAIAHCGFRFECQSGHNDHLYALTTQYSSFIYDYPFGIFIALLVVLYIPGAFLASDRRKEREPEPKIIMVGALFLDFLEIIAIFLVFKELGYIEHGEKPGNFAGVFLSLAALTAVGLLDHVLKLYYGKTEHIKNIGVSLAFVVASFVGLYLVSHPSEWPPVFLWLDIAFLHGLLFFYYLVRPWNPESSA